ncbi:PHD finger protein ALFIN-LIKE 3-like [Cucumis melo var. makuwa]|uniref:PHD finger protein ALFIN-LIKE n=1 Tax=Cucumis melo var. makuwa TaxID=1194695 RepID=A0A5A7VHJ0_CUCMM|nr:PHD finger protein ALFIN-LIKE 3-like [Cucumis melo var. makuwa]
MKVLSRVDRYNYRKALFVGFTPSFGLRRRLFNIINDMPTVFEVVTNIAKQQVKEKSSTANGSKSKSSFKSSEAEMQGTCARQSQARKEVETYEEDKDEHSDILCRACGENYASDEFWICCDIYEKWFHGKFVV